MIIEERAKQFYLFEYSSGHNKVALGNPDIFIL